MGALADASQQAMPADNELRVGTVARLTNPITSAPDGIYVWFTADTSVVPTRCFALVTYNPVVGDVVQVFYQGGQFLILGKAAKRGALG